jgi:monofunctional biosynthetic peptidoglycan transglycosylase
MVRRVAKNAKSKPSTSRKTKSASKRGPLWRRALRWAVRAFLGAAALLIVLIAVFSVLRPPTTPYVVAEAMRHGGVERTWVPLDRVAPVMARSVVAAEDANFCLHWGFDMAAIRDALDSGAGRGASTLTQQTVKNVFLWHGRSWPRKALEALITPLVEVFWSKRRIVEVYLNVAEFDQGVFGVEAAARHYFGVSADALSPVQAARLAAVLPDPKGRSASEPSAFVRARSAAILDGAETIRRDGRAACFED